MESPLNAALHQALLSLHQHPYPHVSNPPNCKKRGAVSLILRVRPDYLHWPESPALIPDRSIPVDQQLDSFFSQDWVQYGDPEVLFIKRASRVGDRWTGHVALPGGMKDLDDRDDKVAAIREAAEEIGLDLLAKECIYVSNLPERLVTASWGSVPYVEHCNFERLGSHRLIPKQAFNSLPIHLSMDVQLYATVEATAYGSRISSLGLPQSSFVSIFAHGRVCEHFRAVC
jgi:8-oxo-dGTP pyrophosphatase MutT (NUDIX family)